MSSISGVNLPLKTALVFAAKIKFCEALGPAPQETYFLINSDALLSVGRDLLDRETA